MSRVGRLVRGVAAAGVLLGIVAALPAALVLWGTSPVRGELGGDSLRDVFYELGSERVLAGALTIAAWAVWALFLRALIVEVVELRRGHAEGLLAAGYGEVPAGGPLRALARRLVTWLALTVGSMGPLGAGDAVTAPPPALAAMLPPPGVSSSDWATAAATPTRAAAEQGTAEAGVPRMRVTVTEPSDAWNLAERFLGDGLRWRELWELNRERLQPDGGRWADP
ncbi:MAG TPA: hypothetical protein VFC13_10010, partial [Actinomycetes bacterium]|nr:hypothetical protein [Actinomycetes bacterium]